MAETVRLLIAPPGVAAKPLLGDKLQTGRAVAVRVVRVGRSNFLRRVRQRREPWSPSGVKSTGPTG